jgi:hypothetical protein
VEIKLSTIEIVVSPTKYITWSKVWSALNTPRRNSKRLSNGFSKRRLTSSRLVIEEHMTSCNDSGYDKFNTGFFARKDARNVFDDGLRGYPEFTCHRLQPDAL